MTRHPMIEAVQIVTRADSIAFLVAGAGAGLAAVADVENLVLLLIWCALVVGDLLAGLGRAYILDHQTIQGVVFRRGLIKKLLYMGFILVAASFDVLGSLTPSFGPVMIAVTPFTKTTLTLLSLGEAASLLRNVKDATGGGPAFEFLVRAIDRWNLHGTEPPERRWYDEEAKEEEDKLR